MVKTFLNIKIYYENPYRAEVVVLIYEFGKLYCADFSFMIQPVHRVTTIHVEHERVRTQAAAASNAQYSVVR